MWVVYPLSRGNVVKKVGALPTTPEPPEGLKTLDPICQNCLTTSTRRVYTMTPSTALMSCSECVPLPHESRPTGVPPTWEPTPEHLSGAMENDLVMLSLLGETPPHYPDAPELLARRKSGTEKIRKASTPDPTKTSAEATEDATGQYVGAVKDRMVFMGLNCVLVLSLGMGDYGERFLIKFLDPSGNDLIWFTGNSKFDPGPGNTYNVRATVKAHQVYDGRRQTILTRCQEYVEEPAE